jgi:hypothetical protein
MADFHDTALCLVGYFRPTGFFAAHGQTLVFVVKVGQNIKLLYFTEYGLTGPSLLTTSRTMEFAGNIIAPEERARSRRHHIRQLSDYQTRIAVLPTTTYPQSRSYKVPYIPHSESTLAQLHFLQSAKRAFKVS